jgi:hypothetical protein
LLRIGCDAVHYSTLKREAAGNSEMLVSIYRTTHRHVPEYSNLHGHHRGNLTSKNASRFTLDRVVKSLDNWIIGYFFHNDIIDHYRFLKEAGT